MASSTTDEARELALVEKVEMRIALAKDEKLEGILKTYLPPLLLKMASQTDIMIFDVHKHFGTPAVLCPRRHPNTSR